MPNLCIIPARGGSKRIPRKNIKDFLGKPIIAYSIEAALKSELFDEVMVSTDDIEIAQIAKKYGAKVPFMRSEKNSDDYATTFDVIKEVLLNYELLNKTFDYTSCIYACAPFVTPKKLTNTLNLLQQENFDCVLPVTTFGFPIQRAFRINKKNKTTFFHPEFSLTRSQDLEQSYHDVGQFFWMNTNKCLKKKAIITNNTGSIIVSELEAQDIDNEVDWKLAELKFKMMINGE